MKYRKLGKTGLKVSVIGLGTDQLYGDWGKQFSQTEVNKIVEKAKKFGINLIDTAECYGDHLAESLIGNAIRSNRKDWIIATKFGHKYYDFSNKVIQCSPKQVIQQLDESLKALKTDYIDIYQFHSLGNEYFDQAELWELLEKKVEDGTIRHLGNSLVNSAVLTADMFQLDSATKLKTDIIQVVYNRLNKKAEKKVLPFCQRQNLGVIARIPLARGHLSGKYDPSATFPANDKRSTENKEQTIKQLELVQEIKRAEVPKGMNMVQWALSWCLQNPAVSTTIPGIKNIEQLEINAKTADLEVVSKDHPLNCTL